MTASSLAFVTARFALVCDEARGRMREGVGAIDGWPRFWSYWFSAGVPAAGSH